MNRQGRSQSERTSGRSAGRTGRLGLTLLLGLVVIGTSGCSGGSGGGGAPSNDPSQNPPPPPVSSKPSGRGTVVVTVRDVLGAPVAGADVRIYTYWTDEDKRVVADGSGRAEIKDVIASTVTIDIFAPDSYAEMNRQTVSADGVLTIDVTAYPTADGTGGIVAAQVPAGGVSEDGRTLEFSLQIVQVPPDANVAHWTWDPGAVRILPCTPDSTNDLPQYRADCVSGPNGFDAAYEGVAEGPAVPTTKLDAPGPYAAALLIDESSHVLVDDPADARLFAAKYFLTADPDNHVALAAFASDDSASGQVGLLPRKPISLFPIADPNYTVDGRSLFATVDSLALLEGGASPLFAAIDRALDFAAANRTGERNAVVVVTDGRDDTCGTRVQCQNARDAVIQKSKATGVAIVTVGLASAAGSADRETLGLLAQGAAHGAAFWADNPKQLATIVGSASMYLADSKDALEATFRIQSAVAGAFTSGRRVLGIVQLETCPWDCFYTDVPFVVQVP
jgi:hypothetical protein